LRGTRIIGADSAEVDAMFEAELAEVQARREETEPVGLGDFRGEIRRGEKKRRPQRRQFS